MGLFILTKPVHQQFNFNSNIVGICQIPYKFEKNRYKEQLAYTHWCITQH